MKFKLINCGIAGCKRRKRIFYKKKKCISISQQTFQYSSEKHAIRSFRFHWQKKKTSLKSLLQKKKKSKVLSGFKINNINKIFINLLCEEAMLSRTPAQWLNTLHITFTAQSDLLMADHRWVSFRQPDIRSLLLLLIFCFKELNELKSSTSSASLIEHLSAAY